MKVIKTKRLILRALKLSDSIAMYNYAKDNQVGPYAGWRPHKNLAETQSIIKLLISDNEYWAITIDDILIGTLNLNVVQAKSYDPRFREIGFALNPDFWGQGIVPEAVSAVLIYAFETLKVKSVIVKHYDFNYNSASVVNKFNFREIKRTLDYDYLGNSQVVIIYEMNRKDYRRSDLYE